MTLFIIGFALLLGLIITLEVKSRKREKRNDQKYLNITKNALGNQLIKFEERIQNSQDCLEDDTYRKFAMLYAKGIDSVATIRLKQAKEKGYFDWNFFFKGEEHEFYRFDVVKDNEITIVALPVIPSINKPFKRITIFKNGLFTALDFVKDEQILKQQKPNLVAESIDLVIEDIINTKTNDLEVTRTLNQCIEALKLIKEEIKQP